MNTDPNYLVDLWKQVEGNHLDYASLSEAENTLKQYYRKVWMESLVLPGETDLETSLIKEGAEYFGVTPEQFEGRARQSTAALKETWEKEVDPMDAGSIEAFYDASEHYIYELMWWHTLKEDLSPLAYVVGLEFAKKEQGRQYLDIGAGVGAGGLLFRQEGFDVFSADISSTMLRCCQWRFQRRGEQAKLLDLKTESLPENAFDFVTAMDVFEHAADPLTLVDDLARTIRSQGCLFGRVHCAPDPARPQHIVSDFTPTMERLKDQGFQQVWHDQWLWGHVLLRKD